MKFAPLLIFSNEETDYDTRPVITGWTIRGHSGWKIVSVVERKSLSHNLGIAQVK